MRTLFASLLILAFAIDSAAASVLERMTATQTLKIGFREDSVPISYRNQAGEPAGYSVNLCRAVAERLKKELDLPALTVIFQPVSAENRFEAIQRGDVDLLCGATTATLSRRARVDFSLPVFIDGAGVLYRRDGPSDFVGLNGGKIGVRAGTTTEEALANTLHAMSIEAEIIDVGDHMEGLRRLEAGDFQAYFADQIILWFLLSKSSAPTKLRLSERFFTSEPYALALPRGDSNFRLAVDRTLSRIYRDGSIERIFAESFGPQAKPTDLLRALYIVSTLPE